MTPGWTRGQLGCWGQEEKQDQEGQEGAAKAGGPGGGLAGRPGALVMRPPAGTDAGAGARAGPGRALSPTASVMKATWMKSDSQLSTYMNHMAPQPRPPPTTGTGLRAPVRATRGRRHRRRVPAPRTVVRRRREQPGPRAALGRDKTSAACRRGGPTAAAPSGARPRTAGLPGLHQEEDPLCNPGRGASTGA